jgi:hypothetical protein
LEDSGGSGSAGAHFEKLVFGDETMVSDDTTDAKYTAMSLSVAKDSGWYEVDMTSGENYFWGKDEGCSIFETTCPHANVTEFCNVEGHRGCSDNHMYKTSCSSSQFTGSNCNIYLNTKSCKVNHTSNTNAFIYGTDSVCLPSTVSELISIQMDQEISVNATKSPVQVIRNHIQFIPIRTHPINLISCVIQKEKSLREFCTISSSLAKTQQ